MKVLPASLRRQTGRRHPHLSAALHGPWRGLRVPPKWNKFLMPVRWAPRVGGCQVQGGAARRRRGGRMAPPL